MALKLIDGVKQLTETAGRADFVLGLALVGWRRFDAGYSAGETLVYEAHAVNNAGARTGLFEVGIGQFVIDGEEQKIRRLVWLDGSDAGGLKTDFAVGKKHISVSFCAAQAVSVPVSVSRLGAVPSIYVRIDGSDENNGFENTPAGALRTLQAAMDLACGRFEKAIVAFGAPGNYGNGASPIQQRWPCEITYLTSLNDGGRVVVDTVIARSMCSVVFPSPSTENHGVEVLRVVADGACAAASVFGERDVLWGPPTEAEQEMLLVGDIPPVYSLPRFHAINHGMVSIAAALNIPALGTPLTPVGGIFGADTFGILRFSGRVTVEGDVVFQDGYVASEWQGRVEITGQDSFSTDAIGVTGPLFYAGPFSVLTGVSLLAFPNCSPGINDGGYVD